MEQSKIDVEDRLLILGDVEQSKIDVGDRLFILGVSGSINKSMSGL